ncbi:glucuronate isomerase [Tateyamaria sp. ANG-S1]|uniref:glucuronate isomerase n=1 Tax=Tateyamaria sp. ANG-S1 TaxID=1577905 RepID=UPI00057D28BB|nr:glucuronate isomerase [Tateyamaria sp. ANG-S1]KIC49573.1 glucuronate isomerase [Tateyamaria sp. ANG-S1]
MSLKLSGKAAQIYDGIKGAPIVSPHGHCDPAWFDENAAFSDPADLLVIPDHYVFRMLYSQGVPLDQLGVGIPPEDRDPRAIFRLFAAHWHLFLGTPSQLWIEYELRETLGCDLTLGPDTADAIYDHIAAWLTDHNNRPRALFDRFGIEVLATTDAALDPLTHHAAIRDSDWTGHVIPTFRPDALLNPRNPEWAREVAALGDMTSHDTNTFDGFLAALRKRRAAFKALGATATDHAIEQPQTVWLDQPADTFAALLSGDMTDADAFHGHMLIEMAQMSPDDGLVMQLHAGSRRNTNRALFDRFGADKGADIPVAVDWVRGLEPLLNRVGNDPRLTLILFTLDETTYARELAPMAGHWPCLRIGPPWWFHDSAAGIARYLDQVVETAGYHNLAGFNDDTRAFLSIPARHDLWRRAVALHLSAQIDRGYFSTTTADQIAQLLATDLARKTYRLG